MIRLFSSAVNNQQGVNLYAYIRTYLQFLNGFHKGLKNDIDTIGLDYRNFHDGKETDAV